MLVLAKTAGIRNRTVIEIDIHQHPLIPLDFTNMCSKQQWSSNNPSQAATLNHRVNQLLLSKASCYFLF